MIIKNKGIPFKKEKVGGGVTCSESYSKLVAARTQFRSTSHESLFQAPSPNLRDPSPMGGQGDWRWSKQSRDRKPVTEEQEVVVGVPPAAVCSHCMLITVASSFLTSERPPRPDWQESDKDAQPARCLYR